MGGPAWNRIAEGEYACGEGRGRSPDEVSGSDRPGLMLGPVPRQQIVDVPGRMVGQTAEHIGEPGLRIDAVELGGLDQRVEGGRAMAAGIRAGEGPVAAAYRDRPDRPFGGVVRQAGTFVVEEEDKGAPALEHVVDRLRHRSLSRELGAVGNLQKPRGLRGFVV